MGQRLEEDRKRKVGPMQRTADGAIPKGGHQVEGKPRTVQDMGEDTEERGGRVLPGPHPITQTHRYTCSLLIQEIRGPKAGPVRGHIELGGGLDSLRGERWTKGMSFFRAINVSYS